VQGGLDLIALPTRARRVDGETPKGAVLIVHGLAEHKGRYAHVQEALASAGYASHAIDLRGHGEAEGFPGKVGSPDELVDDVAAGMDDLRAAEPGPYFLVSHSMGTLPVLAYLGERGQDGIAGIVLSACPIAPGRATLDALADPDAPGIPPETISRDPEVVRAYAEDRLVFNEHVPPECTAAVMLVSQRAFQGAGDVTLPALVLHGGADPIADPSGSEDILAALGSADKTITIYDGLYHEIFNEPEQEQVLGDMVAWLDAHR
jgi:alpha-beta hydrolase superfamily lysophospholipase